MLKGLMDHWVPTNEKNTVFWRSDIDKAISMLDDSCDTSNVNNFTFYTKWFTNGIKSDLPFLRNDPFCSNVKTNNEWGKQIIDHLHSKGITAGAMLQCLAYERETYGEGSVLKKDGRISSFDVGDFAKTLSPNVVADYITDEFLQRLKAMVSEQMEIFKDFDYIFLEFEGLIYDRELMELSYINWLQQNGLPLPSGLTFSNETIRICRDNYMHLWFAWSDEARIMYTTILRHVLNEIQEIGDELSYKGKFGFVFCSSGYETLFAADILPNKNWILVPWEYFTPDIPGKPVYLFQEMLYAIPVQYGKSYSNASRGRIETLKRYIKKWRSDGYKIIFLGDATVQPDNQELTEELYRFCEDEKVEGFLGMGNPVSGGLIVNLPPESIPIRKRFLSGLYGRHRSDT